MKNLEIDLQYIENELKSKLNDNDFLPENEKIYIDDAIEVAFQELESDPSQMILDGMELFVKEYIANIADLSK